MNGTSFHSGCTALEKVDPSKRVNYTFGLVMGVEEFLQTDAYFLGKHRLANRLLHGYGTVCGLQVTAAGTPPAEIRVTPGCAINPRGEDIHVSQLMCVRVNEWLAANVTALTQVFGNPPATLSLCVVLCYRECPTDVVPIPGEPCRTQADAMAPSRIADSFELMLCLDPAQAVTSPPTTPASTARPDGLHFYRPSQVEESAIRAFGALLSQVEVSSTAATYLTLEQMADLVRGLETTVGSPPLASPPVSSPPTGPPYFVRPTEADEILRAGFRVWVTEVRPTLGQGDDVGPCEAPRERCVLLADATVTVDPTWTVTALSISDARRPFLLPTRVLQELRLPAPGASASGGSYASVAAGFFRVDGTPDGLTLNALTATPSGSPDGVFLLSFPGYQNPRSTLGLNYVVKGTPQNATALGSPPSGPLAFELVDFANDGIRVRVVDGAGGPGGSGTGFSVEIGQIGAAP